MNLVAYGLRDFIEFLFPTGWKLLPMLCGILLLFVLLIFYTKRSRKAVSLAIVISFGILLAGQAVYRASEQRCFLVTVLGQKQEEVVVVTYAGKTDVIDLTGDHRNPKYV